MKHHLPGDLDASLRQQLQDALYDAHEAGLDDDLVKEAEDML